MIKFKYKISTSRSLHHGAFFSSEPRRSAFVDSDSDSDSVDQSGIGGGCGYQESLCSFLSEDSGNASSKSCSSNQQQRQIADPKGGLFRGAAAEKAVRKPLLDNQTSLDSRTLTVMSCKIPS